MIVSKKKRERETQATHKREGGGEEIKEMEKKER
jgi:hypothetical protein